MKEREAKESRKGKKKMMRIEEDVDDNGVEVVRECKSMMKREESKNLMTEKETKKGGLLLIDDQMDEVWIDDRVEKISVKLKFGFDVSDCMILDPDEKIMGKLMMIDDNDEDFMNDCVNVSDEKY